MAEHSDLISEMPFLEKLNTEERLKLAKKRRSQQLKKWSQREKEFASLTKRKKLDQQINEITNSKKNLYKIHFVPSVMLLEAATRNDVEEVKRLLMLGVSADSTNEDGLTALHQCCIDNCEEMMRLLIEFGANVNAKDSEQWTPLHAAATCGHLHLIKILIERGADLLAVNADGNMPYDICEDEQTLDYIESEMAKRGITQELIDETRAKIEFQMCCDMKELMIKGYDLNFKDSNGATPLHIAAANGYMSVIELLLENNVSVDECDNDLWQPIHAAACWGHIDVVEYLIQNGADLEARTRNGETPFDICEDPDLKNQLLQLKSEIESKKAVSSNRLRRSHSTNTRSHSIRRTSIREKSQIAKREAIEEARIWHEKSAKENKKEETETESINKNSFDLNHISMSIDKEAKFLNGIDNSKISQNRADQIEKHDNNNFFDNNNTDFILKQPDSCDQLVSYGNNSSTGTLIDLKKQRSEKHRNSLTNTVPHHYSLPASSSSSSRKLSNDINFSLNFNQNLINNHYVQQSITNVNKPSTYFDTPSSPSQFKKKFRGHPTELIGEDEERRGCCTIC